MSKVKIIHNRWRYHNKTPINESCIILENDDDYVDDLDIEIYDDDDKLVRTITIDNMEHVKPEIKENK